MMSATAAKPRKQTISPKLLRQSAGELASIVSDLEAAAARLGKRRVAVDGAGMPRRAAVLLRQFLLNLAKSQVAIESK